MHPLAAPPSAAARRLRYAPEVLTLLAAVGYVVVDLFFADLGEPVPAYGLLPAALMAAQAASLLLRRWSPLLALAACVALDAAILVLTLGDIGGGAVGVFAAVYLFAGSASGRRRVTVLSVAAATTFLASLIPLLANPAYPASLAWIASAVRVLLQYAAPFVVAELVGARRRLTEALRERAERAEQEREDRVRRAVMDERTAMARELHDIAAHRLTGIIIGTQAARALLPDRGPQALIHLDAVQEDAKSALAELRGTVSLLRNTASATEAEEPTRDLEIGHSPTPTLDAVSALVADGVARGEEIELTIDGVAAPYGPLAETAAYRMVQESLVNAARHAPGARVHVEVRHTTAALTLTVTNQQAPPRPASAPALHGGLGLIGMAERANLLGARLETGPTADGGWRNRLTIPRKETL